MTTSPWWLLCVGEVQAYENTGSEHNLHTTNTHTHTTCPHTPLTHSIRWEHTHKTNTPAQLLSYRKQEACYNIITVRVAKVLRVHLTLHSTTHAFSMIPESRWGVRGHTLEGTGPKQAELCQILQPLNRSESLFVYSLAHTGGFELRGEECVQIKGVHIKY